MKFKVGDYVMDSEGRFGTVIYITDDEINGERLLRLDNYEMGPHQWESWLQPAPQMKTKLGKLW